MPGEFDVFRRPGKIGDNIAGLTGGIYPSTLRNGHAGIGFRNKIKRAIQGRLDFGNLNIERLVSKSINEIAPLLEDPTLDSGKKIDIASQWLVKLKNEILPLKNVVVIDQPILFGEHDHIWPRFYEPFKFILVYRDPRDQLAEIIRQGHLFYHFRSPDSSIYGPGRDGAFKYAVHALETRICHFQSSVMKMRDSEVMTISFEDLVRNTNDVRERIEDFLGLASDFRAETKFFPDRSKQNIGIHKNLLTNDERAFLQNLLECYNTGLQKPLNSTISLIVQKNDGL